MPRARRLEPPPLRTNDVLTAAVGTMAWTIALVVLLLLPLEPADHWWRWVCVAGIASGLFGIWYVPRLQRKRAAAERHHPAETGRAGKASEEGERS